MNDKMLQSCVSWVAKTLKDIHWAKKGTKGNY